MSVCFQINRNMVNTMCFRVDLIRFQKDSSLCRRFCIHLFGSYFLFYCLIYCWLFNISNLLDENLSLFFIHFLSLSSRNALFVIGL